MPQTESKKGRAAALGSAAVLVGLGAAAIFFFYRPRQEQGQGGTREAAPRVALVERSGVEARPLAGDPEHGRRLYAMHCVSCHGVHGDGLGPAATYLWPAPRDHTDASYMASRSDRDLYRSIAEGGKAIGRSPLMPSWKDRFDSFDIWNLVAFIRTLHARVDVVADRLGYHEIILTDARVEGIGKKLGTGASARDHRVVFHRFYDADDALLAVATYPELRLGGRDAGLALLLKPDGSLAAARTRLQVSLKDRSPLTVDRYLEAMGTHPAPIPGFEDLSQTISLAVQKALEQVQAALDQEKEDLGEARRVYDASTKDAASLPRGQRLYLQSCAQCHGATGRVLGPWITEREFQPRNHADGTFMNLLSDEYIRSVTRNGGLLWNISSSMPANPSLSGEDLSALLAFMRSLAVPKGDGVCPCSVMAAGCMQPDEKGGCCCKEGHSPDKLCSRMKK